MATKLSIFTSLLSFGSNNQCFCCKSPSEPTNACVNHGIFLCQECAKEMDSQTNMQIKEINTTDGWSDKYIKTISYGGNARLDEFLGPYLVSLEKDKYSINVFNLKATEFYTQRLYAFANTGYFSEPPPSLEEGTRLRDNVDLLNLEQPHPRASHSEDLLDLDNERPMKVEDEDIDLFDKLDNNIKELWETTGDIFQVQTQKIWRSTTDIREKTKGVWDTTEEKTKVALDKTSQFTKETWDKTKVTAGEAAAKTVEFFSGLKEKTSSMINDESEDKLDFKKFFGWFKSEEEVKKPTNDVHEQQYFDFEEKQNQNEGINTDNVEEKTTDKPVVQDAKLIDDDEDTPIQLEEQSNEP